MLQTIKCNKKIYATIDIQSKKRQTKKNRMIMVMVNMDYWHSSQVALEIIPIRRNLALIQANTSCITPRMIIVTKSIRLQLEVTNQVLLIKHYDQKAKICTNYLPDRAYPTVLLFIKNTDMFLRCGMVIFKIFT